MLKNTQELVLIVPVNRALDELGLVRAELARILGLMCSEVFESKNLEALF